MSTLRLSPVGRMGPSHLRVHISRELSVGDLKKGLNNERLVLSCFVDFGTRYRWYPDVGGILWPLKELSAITLIHGTNV